MNLHPVFFSSNCVLFHITCVHFVTHTSNVQMKSKTDIVTVIIVTVLCIESWVFFPAENRDESYVYTIVKQK